MRNLLAFVALVLSSGPTSALDPPARFDYAPNPSPTVIPTADIEGVCRPFGSSQRYGCAFIIEKKCFVFVNSALKRTEKAAVLRHEFAHCNGWPANHPS